MPFNVTAERIDEIVAIYYEAEKAESDKSKEFGEQLEAKVHYDNKMGEAEYIFRKHRDFIYLEMKYDVDKQRKIFSIIQFRSARKSEWIKQIHEFYNRVLDDAEVVDSMSKFGITREDLEAGRQKIIDADNARIKHSKERGEAQDATLVRDDLFRKLSDIVDELTTICNYALEDRPQLMEKLGIQVLSPGYKRKKKDEKEVQGEDGQNHEDQGQELEKEKGTDKSEKKVNTGSSDSETICIESKESQEG